MVCRRFGCSISSRASRDFICLRWVLGWDAHRLHGRDRDTSAGREVRQAFLGAVDERPYDHVSAVVAGQTRRHGCELSGEEEVEQKGLQGVFPVVTERDLGAPEFVRDPVENGTAQASAHGAGDSSRGDGFLHDAVGVLSHDAMVETVFGQPCPKGLGIVPRLALVQVHGEQLEVDGRAAAQGFEQEQQRVAVLTARERDHDAIAGRDQLEIRDGPAGVVEELALRVGYAWDSSWGNDHRGPAGARVCATLGEVILRVQGATRGAPNWFWLRTGIAD